MSLSPDAELLPTRFAYLTGFVQAGGASRRMGRPKAVLLIDGETMLDRQVRLLRSVASRVVIVGGNQEYSKGSDVLRIPDLVMGRGPLAGIYTALAETRVEFNLILGCDLPFISRRLLRYLAVRAIAAGGDVTVPCSWDGRLQPLCAVYRRQALHAVRSRITLGDNTLRSFFPKVHCTVIPWRDLARAGFRQSIFGNMNTPEDYELARRRLEAPSVADAPLNEALL